MFLSSFFMSFLEIGMPCNKICLLSQLAISIVVLKKALKTKQLVYLDHTDMYYF